MVEHSGAQTWRVIVTVFLQGKRRFEAEWISKQYHDPDGEWNPDRDEFTVTYHATKEAAEQAAIVGSKRADDPCEWILVAEQEFRGYEWVDIRRWTGDWDGLHEETFNISDVS